MSELKFALRWDETRYDVCTASLKLIEIALRQSIFTLALLGVLVPSFAQEISALEDEAEVFTQGDLQVTDPWAASAIGNAHAAQVFFEFRNRGTAADQLLDARTPLASGHALRLVTQVNGQPKLRTLQVIEIPAGGDSFELSRHGYYIELTGLTVPLTMGKRFSLLLTFKRAGRMTVEVTSRFHSPKLTRRIRDAARRGDVVELNRLRESP